MKWDSKPLNELGEVARGKSRHRPRDDSKLYGGEYPFIQTAEVKSAEMYITAFNQTYNDVGLAQSKLWNANTLCVTIAANIAESAILSFPACFPDSIIGFIPFKNIADVRYVKYCFDILKQDCKQIAQGATQDNLSLEKLSTIKFPAPPFSTQRRIADILSAYDELIENNRRRIKLLEEAAMRLCKEWFVRLRFPGHENAKIVDGVPDGWRKYQLGEIADIVMGQSPKSDFYNLNSRGLPFHQGVTNYGERFVENEIYTTEYTRIAAANSILFSVRAPVGRLNVTKEKIAIGRGLSAINHKLQLQSFLFYMLKTCFYKDNLIGNGAIFASITKDDLHKQEFILPPENLVKQYNEFASKLDQKIEYADMQAKLTQQARDKLLPKLMSGEIEVGDAPIGVPR